MPEWLWEAGIGETRAALVEGDTILEAAIELDDGALRVGHVARARLIDRQTGRVRLDSGEEALLTGPPGIPEGGALTVAITREAIPEPGRLKPPRATAMDAAPAPGPTLIERLRATGIHLRQLQSHQRDDLESAGWSELLDEATSGHIAFPGGVLLMSPTPAMTLFDVDGTPPLDALALHAATAVAQAIRRQAIGGSIGVDFPTLAGKAPRQAVAAAIDAGLDWDGAQPFERTAVNGFGFLQIVRPRPRASLPELLRADPVGAQTRAMLRRLEREAGPPRPHRLPAAVHARLLARPDWLAELARRTGAAPLLESDR